MKLLLLLSVIFAARANQLLEVPSCNSVDADCNSNKESAIEYLDTLDGLFVEQERKYKLAYVTYLSNLTIENLEAFEHQAAVRHNFTQNVSLELIKFSWKEFNDENLTHLATAYFILGSNVTYETFKEENKLSTQLIGQYLSAAVCKFEHHKDQDCKKDFGIDPDMLNVMAESRDPDELLYYWREYRATFSDKSREDYIQYVKILNSSAKSLGFYNLKEKWTHLYENYEIGELMLKDYKESFNIQGENISIETLYSELHSFVKGKLINIYKDKGVDIKKDGHIPAHLLGNMWATSWDNLVGLVKPFPDVTDFDITSKLIENNYTSRQFYYDAERFFVKMGFEPMTDKFWKHSVLEKPDDGRGVFCFGSAWDLYGEDDYRILFCTQVKHADFITVHHEMGHIVYFMQYRNNTFPYREAANPGFHEAVGDLMSLAVNTPSHLRELGLLEPEKKSDNDFVNVGDGLKYKKSDINFLMNKALYYVAITPYCLALELWRYDFFTGKIDEAHLNEEYWNRRRDLQGLEAPITRNETNLDPLAKPHLPFNVPYIRYFFAFVEQYQLYEALCRKAGQYNPNDDNGQPLHLCDYSKGGKQIGEFLRNLMHKGHKDDYTEVIKELTGVYGLSGKSMLQYFFPLYKYLKKENAQSDITPWK